MLRLIKYVRKFYIHIILSAISCVGSSVSMVMLTNFLKKLIDGNYDHSLYYIALILVMGAVSNYMMVYMTGYIGSGLLKNLREDCVKGVAKASPEYMDAHTNGDIIERISADVEVLADFIKEYFKDCLYVPIMVVVYSIYLISINPLLAVCCLFPLGILVPVNIKYMKPIKLMQFQYNKELALTNNNIQEAFDGAVTVKAYNLQERLSKKYYSAMHRILKISNDTDAKQYNLEPVSRAIQELPVGIALILGSILVLNGRSSLGTLIAYISILRNLVEPLAMCYQLVVRSQSAVISVSRVFEVIDAPAEKDFTATDVLDSATAIEFKNVSFRYKEEGADILNNMTFEIKKGSHVAFIGHSGSGKSTVLKLIAALSKPDKGSIKIFGNDYSKLSPEYIRSKIAYVSQDAILFPMSVEDNIRIGNAEATSRDIQRVIQAAKCEEFSNVSLTEHGNNLSGGQRQRLSMARALIKDADIFLLDEPTSALDDDTEAILCETISNLPADKTVIMVTHKLSAVADYDHIYTINGGSICTN